MNVQPELHMDKSGFLAWAQAQEGRFELVGRRVVMMVGGSKAHALVASRLTRALWACLDLERWVVLGSDLAVDVGPESLRYPDAIVDVVGGGNELAAAAPALIAEVLSPSSATLDLGDKAAEYLRLASLQAYVVLAQDEPKAWVWVRGPHGFAAGPEVMSGPDAVICVPALGIALTLAELYGQG
ncbi:MAG: Uma2 family endonuclease [Hyphomicrobiales bacterium]|nr:Uma2 family endonuclease [Hyphomicrobiales bacterium]